MSIEICLCGNNVQWFSFWFQYEGKFEYHHEFSFSLNFREWSSSTKHVKHCRHSANNIPSARVLDTKYNLTKYTFSNARVVSIKMSESKYVSALFTSIWSESYRQDDDIVHYVKDGNQWENYFEKLTIQQITSSSVYCFYFIAALCAYVIDRPPEINFPGEWLSRIIERKVKSNTNECQSVYAGNFPLKYQALHVQPKLFQLSWKTKMTQ